MLPTLESFGITSMTFGERLDLIVAIWDSIPLPQSESDLSPERKAELDRQLDAADADTVPVVTWKVMRERLGLTECAANF